MGNWSKFKLECEFKNTLALFWNNFAPFFLLFFWRLVFSLHLGLLFWDVISTIYGNYFWKTEVQFLALSRCLLKCIVNDSCRMFCFEVSSWSILKYYIIVLSIDNGVPHSEMLLYLHLRDSKIFSHPAKFGNFKDEKLPEFKTVSVSQSKNLLDWKLVV